LLIAGRMKVARDIHEEYAVFIRTYPERAKPLIAQGFGDGAWHEGWVATYEDALALLAVLLRGCVR
jgi:hypothetical protein